MSIYKDISILMANYNNAAFIAQAIDSVMGQTYYNWKLIVADDASTDNSDKIIRKYLTDNRIKYVCNENNIGYIKTLKKLIGLANTEIVAILDSDDVISKNAVSEVLKIYNQEKNCGFTFSNFYFCNENLEIIKPGYGPDSKPLKPLMIDKRALAWRTFRRDLYFKAGGFDETIVYAEDWDLILKLEEITEYHFFNEPLYYYRQTQGSHTNDPRKKETGKISAVFAKYNAYKRRISTTIPNVNARLMSSYLLEIIPSCVKIKDFDRFKICLVESFKLHPFNIPGYIYLFYRLIKFPFYRIVRFFYPGIAKIYDK